MTTHNMNLSFACQHSRNLPLIVLSFLCVWIAPTNSFSSGNAFVSRVPVALGTQRRTYTKLAASNKTEEEPTTVQLNDFFKKPVPETIKNSIALYYEKEPKKELDLVSLVTAAPSEPGSPRPLWVVILASVPSGLLWYGYYKFAVEEELFQMELASGKTPRGLGGYGTLGPFTYGLLLGPLAAILHIPGGVNWSAVAIIFIYYTQFLLYDRVNNLYADDGQEKPLTVWWCLPIFFPFNLIVGLRQVHFLSQYFYEKRGADPPPNDPVADFFPFIKASKFTWQEFFLTPSLWCSLLEDTESIDRAKLPAPVQELFSIGEKK